MSFSVLIYVWLYISLGKKGELCVAQHKDGEWYRAAIVSINRDRTAEVLFIDYGNVILVNLDDVKEIK